MHNYPSVEISDNAIASVRRAPPQSRIPASIEHSIVCALWRCQINSYYFDYYFSPFVEPRVCTVFGARSLQLAVFLEAAFRMIKEAVLSGLKN